MKNIQVFSPKTMTEAQLFEDITISQMQTERMLDELLKRQGIPVKVDDRTEYREDRIYKMVKALYHRS